MQQKKSKRLFIFEKCENECERRKEKNKIQLFILFRNYATDGSSHFIFRIKKLKSELRENVVGCKVRCILLLLLFGQWYT